MKNKISIVSFGEILYDVFPDQSHLGGAPLNFAVHLHRLGVDVQLISAVGNDIPGKRAVERISAIGLDTSAIAQLDIPTGKVTVTLDDKMIPSYIFDSDSAYDHIQVPENFKFDADLLCFGTLAQRNADSRNSLNNLLEKFQGKVFCDVNLRQKFYSKELLFDSLRASNMVKVNEDELPEIAAFFDIEATPQALAEKFDLEMIIFTKGAAGCEIWYKGNNYCASAPQTTVISTVGAGDAFSAGFLASFLKDQNIPLAIQSANRKAAEVLALEGAF